jgi:hypothetical protein
VELGDDAKYAVKGEGTILFQLESGGSLEAQDVLYVPGLKKNLLSVSVMEDRGFVVMFKKGKVLICPEGASPDTTMSIGVREGNLYRLKGKPVQALVHDSDNLCELWHKRMGHLHYRALPILREIVTGLPDFSVEQQGVCRGCALGKNAKAAFPSSESRSKGILDLIHSDVCGPRSVAEDEEQEAPKGEQCSETSSSGSQPSGGEEELAPSISVRRPRWFMQTLRDAQEHVEAPRSIFRESRPPKKFPNFVVLMSSIIDF